MRRLALRVRERTLELEAANRELEAFAYSVAHDLRGPLSVIVGYAETLIEDHSAQWPDQPRQLAGAILASGEHMQRLIDGLLRLSQFGRQPLSKGPVDTRALVGEVVDELRRQHAGREVFVHVGEIPGCVGDQALLRQVLVNLLSNAFKFTRTREKPLVTVIGWTEGRETVYCVRDNGAGFDMQQADKLFAAFQRFHDSDEYEGTGIGLSIASRIVQRHGGRIWASAEVGKGAAFYFSIPD
ncbi:light-regulated signal transduction histidine kinase (bacteriophytochrome) [Bradyrhizobium japonicum]|uniref:sensor histidine kinase n=1 Tax=Bradyrhizobium diazoefficiens TaxID=1355477 RepID=UPI003470CDA1